MEEWPQKEWGHQKVNGAQDDGSISQTKIGQRKKSEEQASKKRAIVIFLHHSSDVGSQFFVGLVKPHDHGDLKTYQGADDHGHKIDDDVNMSGICGQAISKDCRRGTKYGETEFNKDKGVQQRMLEDLAQPAAKPHGK